MPKAEEAGSCRESKRRTKEEASFLGRGSQGGGREEEGTTPPHLPLGQERRRADAPQKRRQAYSGFTSTPEKDKVRGLVCECVLS